VSDPAYEWAITVAGYPEMTQKNQAFCSVDCDVFNYLFFHTTNAPKNDPAFASFLKQNQGNSFVGSGASIGLGCVTDGIIGYQNDSDALGMTAFTLSDSLSRDILSATVQKPITLRLAKRKYTGGRGAPDCYSHVTEVEHVQP